MERRTFLNSEFISGCAWVAVGLGFCVGGVHYGFFNAGVPGPGLIPIMVGIILSSLGLVNLVPMLRSDPDKREVPKRFFPETDSFRRVFWAILSLAFYALSFEYAGFLLSTLLLFIFLMRFIDQQKWTTVWITALLTAGFSYLLFCIFLRVPFPKGIFGI
jgi:hypothetical protein